MGGITCNAEGFAGETGAVDVLEGGERDPNDLLSCSHYPLKGLAAGRVAGAIPHSDAASQNALDGASVEGAHDGGRGSGSSEFAEEVETLLCFLAFLASAAVYFCFYAAQYTYKKTAIKSMFQKINCWVCSLLKGVFTPGKSPSSLALVRTKYNVDFFCLVQFAFTLPFLQVNQKL